MCVCVCVGGGGGLGGGWGQVGDLTRLGGVTRLSI